MSATISTDIFCDGCAQWNPDVTVTGWKPEIREARAKARRIGWRCNNDGDRCPNCIAQEDGNG
jgi:hypothetical protein